jgi:hypothetical protein
MSKPHILCWDETGEEDVYSFSDGEWHGDDSVCGGFAVEAADKIG